MGFSNVLSLLAAALAVSLCIYIAGNNFSSSFGYRSAAVAEQTIQVEHAMRMDGKTEAAAWQRLPQAKPPVENQRFARQTSHQAKPPVEIESDSKDVIPRLRRQKKDVIPKIIWQYWDTVPGHEVFDIVKFSCKEWQVRNPGWEHVLVNRSYVISKFPELHDIWSLDERTIEKRANMARNFLIAKYGGVWADATSIPTLPLDAWIHEYSRASGAFMFKYTPTLPKKKKKRPASNWFIAAEAGNPIMTAWRDLYAKRWIRDAGKHWTYYKHHYTLQDALHKDYRLETMWNEIVYISADCAHHCQHGCPVFWGDHVLAVKGSQIVAPVLKHPGKFKQLSSEFWRNYDKYHTANAHTQLHTSDIDTIMEVCHSNRGKAADNEDDDDDDIDDG